MNTKTLESPVATLEAPEDDFVLTAPEPLVRVAPDQANERVPMDPARRSELDGQLDKFVEGLMTMDVNSDEFKRRLDTAFDLGRKEVTQACELLSADDVDKNFVGMERSPAFVAIQELRSHLDKLNPATVPGGLLGRRRLLGFIPWGKKIDAYFAKFKKEMVEIKKVMGQVLAAKDGIQREVSDLDVQKKNLWEIMKKLGEAIYWAQGLDRRIAARVDELKATDPQRARALQQECLFYARQNLEDMMTQQAVNVNGYLAMDVQKKTGREVMNGCSRIATTGMSALRVAAKVSRNTANQVEVMEMLTASKSTIGKLVEQTGTELEQHAQRTADFAANPIFGIEQIQKMFSATFRAMDTMDNFRAKAIESMGTTNAIMASELQRAQGYVDRVRAEMAAGGQTA